jgi:hypothetical protein
MPKQATFRRATLAILGLSLLALTGCPKSGPESSATGSTASPGSAAPATAAQSSPAAPTNLSLDDRRTVEQYDQKFMPGYTETLTKYCPGSSIKIAIDWNSLMNGSEGSKTIEALTNSNAINRSVESLTQAFQNLCTDDIGRKAVAGKVTLIKVEHLKDAKAPSFSFNNGVATLQLDVNKSDSLWVQDMQKTLAAGL